MKYFVVSFKGQVCELIRTFFWSVTVIKDFVFGKTFSLTGRQKDAYCGNCFIFKYLKFNIHKSLTGCLHYSFYYVQIINSLNFIWISTVWFYLAPLGASPLRSKNIKFTSEIKLIITLRHSFNTTTETEQEILSRSGT